ncbi:MAG: hypothetical protein KDJ87_17560 [Rhizobiaceae bacterium]|nr:hypothetical protein [Rhizobiaceae bacterium]
MRFLGRLARWIVIALLLIVLGLAAPVAYVELACHAPVTASPYSPILTDPNDRRPEAATYLTYPEWHIVYAYDGLADVLRSSDESEFDYGSSIWRFWESTCALTRVADAHGGADRDTRLMIYTIGASFTLEMSLKAAYEETVGWIFAASRGPVKTPQDEVAAAMAADYAAFLRQTPWYRYDFGKEVRGLWAAPVTDRWRGWERRIALGGEWKAKALYAEAIAAGVAATSEAKLTIRSIVSGMEAASLSAIPDVSVQSETPDGIVIETPRYARFTEILWQIARSGGTIREIAGNDDIMVSITLPPGEDYIGPGEVIARLPREGFPTERVLVDTKVADIARLLAVRPLGDPGLEHIYDY